MPEIARFGLNDTFFTVPIHEFHNMNLNIF